jgi:hypothetical protein
MSGGFAFRFKYNTVRPALLICCNTTVSSDEIVKAVKADVENNLLPDCVYLLGPTSHKDDFLNLFCCDSFNEEFESFVGGSRDKLVALIYNSAGEIIDAKTELAIDKGLRDAMMSQGMLDIFKRRQGLITSSSSFHFSKPSGDHCCGFIRASNLLVAGEEVAFLAISLLDHFSSAPDRIYVDTSSISYLVSVAALMSGRYSGRLPLIESFESYTALKKSYDFVESASSLVIISATTSGGLAAEILKKNNFTPEQVVTLFYSRLQASQHGIFNVACLVSESIKSSAPEDCSDCFKGSKVIKIVGDQFLPETPSHSQVVIKKVDFSPERGRFFKDFAAKNLLKWRVTSDPRAEAKEHFYINVEQYLGDMPKGFSEKLHWSVKKHVSRDVEKVIALDDPGSISLMEEVKKIAGESGVSWLTMSQLDEQGLKDSSSVVVIAGAITSGRKLLDASRKLRCISEQSSILYLVGFSKIPSKDALEQLRKDLELGGRTLVVMNECRMPRVIGSTRTSWDSEYDFLRKIGDDQLLQDPIELPGYLKARLEMLSQDEFDPNDLFLPSPSGEPLKLRDTFAFWSGLDIDYTKSTQADVYWTIQSILHDMRAKPDGGGLASLYHSTVISPACFDRYNDGVIQACLLRAATSSELNYSISDDFSQKMMDFLISVIEGAGGAQGEGVLEFLMAMCLGHLRINNEHVRELLEKAGSLEVSEDIKLLLDQLAKQILSKA